jgi:hypothetical protein
MQKTGVIDSYESLIWTEKYNDIGDFSLKIPFKEVSEVGKYKLGQKLGISLSYVVMIIENIELTASEGKKLIKLSGRSLESILDQRVVIYKDDKAKDDKIKFLPSYTVTDTPAGIIRRFFYDICVRGLLSPADRIPMYVDTQFVPRPTLPYPSEEITINIPPSSIYTIAKDICSRYNLGFRLIRNPDGGTLHFSVYTGDDRTSSQKEYLPVIFDPDLNTAKGATALSTSNLDKNVGYVFTENEVTMIKDPQSAEDVEGFDRKVMAIDATSLPDNLTPYEYTRDMKRIAEEELYINSAFSELEVEIEDFTHYVYNRHYNLGDLVEARVHGQNSVLKVTEHILTVDREGIKSYPTLVNVYSSTPNSWRSMGNMTWLSYEEDLTTTWSTL